MNRLIDKRAKLRWGILGLLLVGLLGRSLPYLAPIRASDIAQKQLAVEFRDRNGLPLGTLLSRDQEQTTVVPLAQVSPLFLQAIIAAEDQRFYQHGALDLRALGRSLLEAAQAGHIVSGASTITMQLARMLEPTPRTLGNKAQEIWLAWRLAAGMSKDEILAAYLNRLPMGSNIYGVEAAAQVYFGIPAAELSLAQASLLAGLPNNPVNLDPYTHWQASKRRQAYVLQRLVEEGHLSRPQAERAAAEELAVRSRQQGIVAAPHALFWLAAQLPAAHPAMLRTTIDRPLQRFVEAQVQQIVQSLANNQVHQAAALVIHNPTGEVLAYVGSPDYFAANDVSRNDGVQALRQPGSTLKPFLYQFALETGTIQPNTILPDVPTRYGIPGARVYSPVDYSEVFHGPMRVRAALANSLNVPAVRVLEQVGVAPFLTRLRQLGFRHLTQSPEHYGLGLALGSGEVSLWELARAYLTLARQGDGIEPTLLPRADGSRSDSSRLTEAAIPGAAASSLATLPPSPTWALIRHMLSDRHARALSFGVDSVLNLPFQTAVKTGTSSDFRDTWTVGFSTDYTVATWVGNFSGESMRQVSGVMGAAPLWQRILLHLHQAQEPPAFSPLGNDWVKRPICAISGYKPTPDCPAIVDEYLAPKDLLEYERSAQKKFQLPPVYNEWLASQPETPGTSPALRILVPREDDYFVLESAAGQAARLAFKIIAPAGESVVWRLNGQSLKTGTEPEFFWTMQPGNWSLEVQSGERRDRVQFQVQPAGDWSGRPGFSRIESDQPDSKR